jgi:hypothetical protein
MSKKPKEKLTLAEFMAQLLTEVKALNSNAEKIAKMVDIFEHVQKKQEEFYKFVQEKGIITRAR